MAVIYIPQFDTTNASILTSDASILTGEAQTAQRAHDNFKTNPFNILKLR